MIGKKNFVIYGIAFIFTSYILLLCAIYVVGGKKERPQETKKSSAIEGPEKLKERTVTPVAPPEVQAPASVTKRSFPAMVPPAQEKVPRVKKVIPPPAMTKFLKTKRQRPDVAEISRDEDKNEPRKPVNVGNALKLLPPGVFAANKTARQQKQTTEGEDLYTSEGALDNVTVESPQEPKMPLKRGNIEGTLWVNRSADENIITLGKYDGLRSGSLLDICDSDEVIGKVKVVRALDIVSFVELVDAYPNDFADDNYYDVRIN